MVLLQMQGSRIVDEVETLQFELAAQPVRKTSRIEHAMRVEADSGKPDRGRDVEATTMRDHAGESGQPSPVRVGIDGIAVPAQTQMLEHMEATDRVAASLKSRAQAVQVGLDEADVRVLARRHWTDVDDLDGTETGDVRDESVDSAADIDVPLRSGLVNELRYEQILMEVVATRRTG